MSEISVVKFQAEHIEQALDILYESSCLHNKGNPKQFACENREAFRPYLHEILNNKDNFGFVALSHGNVAGVLFAGLLTREADIYRNNYYYKIFDLAVGKNYQKLGIGRKLNQAIVKHAQKNGIKQIDLEVFLFNENAIAFYNKLDYVEVSKIMSLKV